jgi:hypothetical protein
MTGFPTNQIQIKTPEFRLLNMFRIYSSFLAALTGSTGLCIQGAPGRVFFKKSLI